MGRVSICQKNCNTIDLRRAQVNNSNTICGVTCKDGKIFTTVEVRFLHAI